MAVNKQWFLTKLDVVQKSQRKVAADLGIDPASFSKCLNGMRKLQTEEAVALAKILGVQLEEVLANFGLIDNKVEESVPLIGWFSADGSVVRQDQGRIKSLDVGYHSMFVIQYRGETALDGWYMYFDPAITPVQVGSVGLMRTNAGTEIVGYALRGYSNNEYRIKSLFEHETITTTELQGFHKVVGARPQF